MKKACPGKYVHRVKLEKPMLDGRKTESVDGIVQQMLCIANMNEEAAPKRCSYKKVF